MKINTIQTTVLDHLFEGVYYVDRERKILLWNRAAERLTGFSSEEVLGRHCFDAVLRHVSAEGKLLCFTGCPLQATLNDGQERETEIFLHHKKGHRVPVHVRVAPVFGENGDVIGAVEMFRDATSELEQKERFDYLERMAFIDVLTGLPNRKYVLDSLKARLEEFRRFEWSFGVLFIDVDHFKRINDEHGHKVGDQMLKMVAAALKAASRRLDIVGRLGGEEFVAVVTNVDEKRLLTVAERFRTLVEFSAMRELNNLSVTISIGAAMAQKGDSCDALLERTDELLYQAKRAGRNRVVS